MTPRAWAVRLLGEHEAKGTYTNLALCAPALQGLSEAERGALTALFYTAVERRLTLDYWIAALAGRPVEELRPHTRDLLRVALADLVYGGTPPYAAVNEAVRLARDGGERAFVNGVLRAAVRRRESLPLPDRSRNEARYLSVAYSFPLPLVRHFAALYGWEQTEQLLAAFDRIAPLSLTVNTTRITREQLQARLTEAGITALPTAGTDGLLLPDAPPPATLPGFAEGLFFVQDEACRLAVAALDIRPGDKVADVCAAPGGKSFLAALSVGDTGHVYAFDCHESKLSLIESGARRLQLQRRITVGARDAREPDAALLGRLDRVICDVPCSGLGVLGKKSDLRYRPLDQTGELPALQQQILSASADYVAPGGRLLYSTCTLNPQENQQIVSAFLATHPAFSLVPLPAAPWVGEDGMATLLPHRDGTDGFFFAVMRRSEDR